MVEIFFGIITRQALRRGTFVSVADIEAAITTYIDAYNDRAKPFAWTNRRPANRQDQTYVNQ